MRFRRLLLFALFLSGPALAGDWTLADTTGQAHRLADYRGKWLIVNFWATWCPPCVAEIPELGKLAATRADLAVIGIAVGYRNSQQVLDFVKARSVNYPIVLGTEDDAAQFGGLVGMPTSFLYSPTGNLIGRHQGPLTAAEIEKIVDAKTNSPALFAR